MGIPFSWLLSAISASSPLLSIVGNRNSLPQNVTLGSETQNQFCEYEINGSGCAMTAIRMRCPNWYVNATSTEVDGSSDLTVSASIEYPIGGTRYQMTIGGSADLAVPIGTTKTFDPHPTLVLPDGAIYRKWVWVRVAGGGHYPTAARQLLSALGEGNEVSFGGNLTNKTLSGSITPANGGGYDTVVLGLPVSGTPRTVLIIGDSIDAGQYETNSSQYTSDANGNQGPFERSFGATHGILNIARATTQAAHWAVANVGTKRLAFMADIALPKVAMGLGRNDYGANKTASQIKADVETVLNTFAPTASTVWVRDLTCTTSSSDGWVTLNNQTRSAGANTTQETNRVAYNAIVSASGIARQTNYYALSPTMTTTNATPIVCWPANWTLDGIHPLAAANAATAAANSV